jgi:hypothetical protein
MATDCGNSHGLPNAAYNQRVKIHISGVTLYATGIGFPLKILGEEP